MHCEGFWGVLHALMETLLRLHKTSPWHRSGCLAGKSMDLSKGAAGHNACRRCVKSLVETSPQHIS